MSFLDRWRRAVQRNDELAAQGSQHHLEEESMTTTTEIDTPAVVERKPDRTGAVHPRWCEPSQCTADPASDWVSGNGGAGHGDHVKVVSVMGCDHPLSSWTARVMLVAAAVPTGTSGEDLPYSSTDVRVLLEDLEVSVSDYASGNNDELPMTLSPRQAAALGEALTRAAGELRYEYATYEDRWTLFD